MSENERIVCALWGRHGYRAASALGSWERLGGNQSETLETLEIFVIMTVGREIVQVCSLMWNTGISMRSLVWEEKGMHVFSSIFHLNSGKALWSLAKTDEMRVL